MEQKNVKIARIRYVYDTLQDHQLDKILEKLSSLPFDSNVHKNALNFSFQKNIGFTMFRFPVIDLYLALNT